MIDIKENNNPIDSETMKEMNSTLLGLQYNRATTGAKMYYSKTTHFTIRGQDGMVIQARSQFDLDWVNKKVDFSIGLIRERFIYNERNNDCINRLENIFVHFIVKNKPLKQSGKVYTVLMGHTSITSLKEFNRFLRVGNEYLKAIEKFRYTPKRGVLKV